MNAIDLINAALKAPATHVVVTTYLDGSTKRHETRSLATAENWAIGERRKIGRDLIARGDNANTRMVRVVSVEISEL